MSQPSTNSTQANISTAISLGTMAAVTSGAFMINRTGLNLNLVVVSPSGSGMNSIDMGIRSMISALAKDEPAFASLMGPFGFSSHIALRQYLENQTKNFISVFENFGMRISDENGYDTINLIKDLFFASGPEGCIGTMATDIHTLDEIRSPCVSVIGISTPDQFMNLLTREMVDNGFLPKFNILICDKPLPVVVPQEIPVELKEKFEDLAMRSWNARQRGKHINISMTAKAKVMLDNFSVLCRKFANGGKFQDQLWNHAHLKALRISGLTACGMPFVNDVPMVDANAAKWAIEFVSHGVYLAHEWFNENI